MILRLLIYNFAIFVLFWVLTLPYFATHQLIAMLVGNILMMGNFFLLIWIWRRVFLKKSIALAGSVIVFKYAILGMIIYTLLSHFQLDGLGFLVGIGLLLPTVLFFAVFGDGEKQQLVES